MVLKPSGQETKGGSGKFSKCIENRKSSGNQRDHMRRRCRRGPRAMRPWERNSVNSLCQFLLLKILRKVSCTQWILCTRGVKETVYQNKEERFVYK